jgi:type IV pilus assembly protein PilY1
MKRRLTKAALIVSGALGIIVPAQSGLLTIASDPLGTATSSIKPNIMFILDDSGSMGSDYMPDYVNDGHNPPSSTAACADAGDDSGGTINGSPDACVFGDPPYNTPDMNGVYYNPGIVYRPGANADGTDMLSMSAANTANWTAVPVNPYTSASTTNLATAYPDRVWCQNPGDAATSGTCRQNTAYQYPDAVFAYGRDGGGAVKYLSSAPYYYRGQTAQFCSDAARTTCVSGSAINPTVHIYRAEEFCTDQELTNCAAGAAVTSSHIYSGIRWCADANTLLDCRRKKGDLTDAAGTVLKQYIYAKHVGVTQSITCPAGTFCDAAPNEGNINVSAVNAAGGTITAITIGGVSVIPGPIAVPAGTTTAVVAGMIAAAIGNPPGPNYVSAPYDYIAAPSGNNVPVTQATAGAAGAGLAIAITTTQIGTQSSIGRIAIGSTGTDNNDTRIHTITVGGTNLLCNGGALPQGFGNGVTVEAVTGYIFADNGYNSSSKRNSVRDAIVARINFCNVNGYTAAAAGTGLVNIIAPVSLGAGPNGQAVARTGSGDAGNLAAVTVTNMGGIQLGASSPSVTTSTSVMSGGRDAIAAGTTLTVRKGVGTFSRTDIVPSNDSYPKAAGRADCAGATCTYAEEMTNFANWYAYYRTRMQMAKTAVGRAFVSINDTYRVGFITICPVSTVNCSDTTNGSMNQNVVAGKYLRVQDFDATHKANWYAKLYAQAPSNYTPLREALARVGLIFAGKVGAGNSTPLTGGLAAADDPMTASCQPSFAILSTDGYWNGGPGRQIDGSALVGNQDNVSQLPYSLQSQGVFDGGTPVASNTLADVALYYYQTDLRTSGSFATNNVPTTNKDTNSNQHMVTFTLGLGLDGLLTYRPDYESASSGDFFDIKQGSRKWPVPVSGQPTTLDDLWHAAVNGRGVFFSAKNPDDLATSLTETLNQLQARVGAGAAAATSNLQPVAGDNFAFTAQYQTSDWIGDLKAKTIDLSTGIVSFVTLWSATTILDSTAYNARNIFTYDATDTGGNLMKHFCWPGQGGATCADGSGLDAAEQAMFHPNQLPQWGSLTNAQKDAVTQASAPAWAGPNDGQHLVNWLRGDNSFEDTGQSLATDVFRERISTLGDIVNAQPAYVKKSPFTYGDTGYAGFKACTEGVGTGCAAAQFPNPTQPRLGTVYTASNDGMLHAFETDVNNNPYYQTAGIATAATGDDTFTGVNTGNGAERWAYIPKILHPSLNKLASRPYTHRYFTDGSPAVGDICISTPCAGQDDWRTILVAGFNSGGRGYYALDVTNPSLAGVKALWEFTYTAACVTVGAGGVPVGGPYYGDCHVGLTYGNPIITKRKSDGKWVVIVTSGYNNGSANGNGDGRGYLYVLDAVTGQILNRLTTNVGTAAAPSGLAKINGWATNSALDNTVLSVYGGDLEGNMWRFELDSGSLNYLTVTKLAAVKDASNNPQPITTRPELGEASTKRVILFGTGKFLEAADKSGPFTVTQSIYALRDEPTVGGAGPVIPDVRNGSAVKVRGFGAYDPATDSVRTVTTGTAPDWATEWGWLIDLPDTGEHVNVDPQLQLGTLVVASNVPTADTCTAGGYSWLNFLDYATGSYIPGVTGNMASTKIATSLAVGLNVVMLPGGKVVTIVTTADNQQLTKDTPVPPTAFAGRRVSWREIFREQ